MLQDFIRMDKNKRGCLGLAGTIQAKEYAERTGDRGHGKGTHPTRTPSSRSRPGWERVMKDLLCSDPSAWPSSILSQGMTCQRQRSSNDGSDTKTWREINLEAHSPRLRTISPGEGTQASFSDRQRCLHSNPHEPVTMLPYMMKGILKLRLKLRTLTWGDYLSLLRVPNLQHECPELDIVSRPWPEKWQHEKNSSWHYLLCIWRNKAKNQEMWQLEEARKQVLL